MPSRTTNKKTSKPSQLDPLKSIRAQLRAMDAKLNVCMDRAQQIMEDCVSIYTEVGKIHSINDKVISDAYERGKNSVTTAPHAVEPEAPKFKVGDWVVIVGPNVIGGKDHDHIAGAQPINKASAHTGDFAINSKYGRYWFPPSSIRPATASEITAFKEAEEAKVEAIAEEKKRAELDKPIKEALDALVIAKARLIGLQRYDQAKSLRDIERELNELLPK